MFSVHDTLLATLMKHGMFLRNSNFLKLGKSTVICCVMSTCSGIFHVSQAASIVLQKVFTDITKVFPHSRILC